MKTVDVPENEVVIKISICPKCNGWVTVAVKHMMTTKGKNEFKKDVFEHNLSVKEISLIEYREDKIKHCSC